MRGESHIGDKTLLEGGFNPRGHQGIGPLGKCHCNFLVTLFWLSLFDSALDKKLFSIHNVVH